MSRLAARVPRRSHQRSRQIAARRRSSGAWATVSASPHAPQVEERAAHVVYVEECETSRSHLRHGRAGQAAEAARRALAALPHGMDAQRLLGLALLELSEARAAAHAFGAALTADPLDVVSLVGLAERRELLEGVGAAESEWQRAWEVEPTSVRSGDVPGIADRLQASRRAAGALDVRDGPPPLTRPALARIHLRGRLYEHAAIEARAVLAREPDRMDMRLTLAEAYWRAGEGELAAAIAAEVRERLPDCVAANLLVATHWLAEGRDASELMARVQAVDPTGVIAQALFDDREVPALFGTDAVPEPRVQPSATQLVAEPSLAETQPLDTLIAPIPEPGPEPPPPSEPVLEDQPEPDAATRPVLAPEPAQSTSPEPVGAIAPAPETEEEPGPRDEPEARPARDEPGADVGLAREPDPQPVPSPALADSPAPVPDSEPEHMLTGDRAAGNAAMAQGRYFDAIRAYGAWLRAARAGD